MRKTLLIVLAIGTYFSAGACDLCGCYLGVLPKFDHNYFGARLRYRGFTGDVPHVHSSGPGHDYDHPVTDTHFHAYDRFSTYELTGRYFLTSRLSATAFIPYSINASEEGDKINTLSGLGDPTLLMQYRIFTREAQSDTTWQHNISVGAGLKLPFGTFDKLYADGEYDPHGQTGTGSLDFLFAANYMARYGKFGFNADVVTRLNTTNANGYHYGNRFNNTIHFIYWEEVKNFKILPQIGAYAEFAPADRLNGEFVSNTGGFSAFASTAIDFFYKNLAFNCTAQVPVIENLDGTQLRNSTRLMTGMTYYF
jgi:hypothetical protein